jgi:hypothetical protein
VSFSVFLTKQSLKKWTSRNHKFLPFLGEMTGNPNEIDKVLDEEFKKNRVVRKLIQKSLTREPDEERKSADRWALVIKNRAVVLDAWSFMITAMTTLYTIAVTGFTLAAFSTNQERPYVILAILIILIIVLIFFKFKIDKRSSWYKQLANYLDSIAKFNEF